MGIQDEIGKERKRQDEKWGEQNHDPLVWRAILGEESGEADKAILEGSALRYREEMVHVAAVAIAAIESLDRGNLEFVSYTELQSENAALRAELARLKEPPISAEELEKKAYLLDAMLFYWPNKDGKKDSEDDYNEICALISSPPAPRPRVTRDEAVAMLSRAGGGIGITTDRAEAGIAWLRSIDVEVEEE